MLARQFLDMIQAKPLLAEHAELLDHEYSTVLASDLMSDVLAMQDIDPDRTILLTGLCNTQALRTADMLDLQIVILCRGKIPCPEDLATVQNMHPHCNLYSTRMSMFDVCGILHEHGMKGSNEYLSA